MQEAGGPQRRSALLDEAISDADTFSDRSTPALKQAYREHVGKSVDGLDEAGEGTYVDEAMHVHKEKEPATGEEDEVKAFDF